MSQEERKLVDNFLVRIDANRGEMGDIYDRWEKEAEAYAGDQELKDNHPNSRVNIFLANIEGQVASMVDKDISITTRGRGPSDEAFAESGRVGLEWTLRQNGLKLILDRHERRRLQFGIGWLKTYWDPDAIDGFGLARLAAPPLQSMFVDSKITDPMNLESADYIAEYMLRSKTWARETYGDMVDYIYFGGSDRSGVFSKDKTIDDEDAFYLIQLWTKTDGKLRLLEFSDDGVLLFDSFKEWTGKKFKIKDDPQPFYRCNEYPYFLTLCYPEEGKLIGFGDGKLLRPLQDMINDLYDQIRRAARPNRLFIDPDSNVSIEDLDQDDGPIPAERPNDTIRVVEMGKVNEALWRLLNAIHSEVQRVTRFSELMLGQPGKTADTATEAAIQQQQGNQTTDHKKTQLSITLQKVCRYLLELMLEHYDEGKWFRLDENEDQWLWINFDQMNRIPQMIPPEEAYLRQFQEQNPGAPTPQWQELTDEYGEAVTKKVELDIEINIGAGLPKNQAFLQAMLEKLSQMVVDGRNAVTWVEIRKFARDILGLPLDDDEEALKESMEMQMQAMGGMPGGMPGGMGMGEEPMMSPDVAGLTAGGNPMQSALPPTGGPV